MDWSRVSRFPYEVLRRIVAYSALVYAMYELKQVESLDKLWPLFAGLFVLYIIQGLWETVGVYYDLKKDDTTIYRLNIQGTNIQQLLQQMTAEAVAIVVTEDRLVQLKAELENERKQLDQLRVSLSIEKQEWKQLCQTLNETFNNSKLMNVFTCHAQKMDELGSTLKRIHNIQSSSEENK